MITINIDINKEHLDNMIVKLKDIDIPIYTLHLLSLHPTNVEFLPKFSFIISTIKVLKERLSNNEKDEIAIEFLTGIKNIMEAKYLLYKQTIKKGE